MSNYMTSSQTKLLLEHFFAFQKDAQRVVSLREFAEHLKIHESTLNLLVNDRRKITERMAAYLARRTGDPRFYDLRHLPHMDPLLSYISTEWPNLKPEERMALRDQVASYRTGDNDKKERTPA